MAAIQSYSMHAGDKLPPEKLQEMLDAETWLTAEDCVRYGLADAFAEDDLDEGTSLEMFSTQAKAAAGTPYEKMFRTAPAFLAAHYTAPAAQAKQPPTPEKHQGEDPDTDSFMMKLLKSMTE